MADVLAAILEAISPKSRTGKIIWGVIATLVIVIGIIEILGALGH